MTDPWHNRLRAAIGVEEVGADGPRAVADVDPKDWHEAVRACRDDLGCDFFDWLSAIDEGPVEKSPAEGPVVESTAEGPVAESPAEGPSGPAAGRTGGFRVVAHLWSVAERRGVLLRALLTEGAVASVTDLYPGADWHERETHEMFGVDFPGHPGLKPLLLAPEFEGHPLRKDFVLASRVVKPWPGAKEPGEAAHTDGSEASPKTRAARKRAPKRPPGVPEDWIEPRPEPSTRRPGPPEAPGAA
ncbi:NADH-quinone oxidoreductase subunit C [Glycomyces sp. A-F 0318]|uniref:NADH-quinone oxidoreductase subunit C n=1 Tax=Glycomyces amatae TaxID=2881355 RepID=UPI001E2BFFCD|nr:NADH-quinone oxidoreductase subunit C [Glycomyces amatae]MCD0444787.1 NADH-quinone oxidoreductase subunit C [Glycomyces amatae]